MNEERQRDSQFSSSVGLALLMTTNRIYEKVLQASMTDPDSLRRLQLILKHCLGELEKVHVEIKEKQPPQGPACPLGTKPEGGMCIDE